MKIYLSNSTNDEIFILTLSKYLKEKKFEIVERLNAGGTNPIKASDSIIEITERSMREADLLILLWSRHASKTKSMLREARAMKMLTDVDETKQMIILAQIGAALPSDFDKLLISREPAFNERTVQHVVNIVEGLAAKTVPADVTDTPSKTLHQEQIEHLCTAHIEGNLTLVCGAGISISAGIPPWATLLDRLLGAMTRRIMKGKEDASISEVDLNIIRDSSSLIVGRYLKNVLQGDFESEVRSALYQGSKNACDTIDAIVELSRPKRARAHLDSIITFNFDDLLERNLSNSSVEHQTISTEGVRGQPNKLSIFHVHGYLPSKGKLDNSHSLVFSEDTYHDQFVDPFSWSNLTQLNKFTQTTCLFVGLSMTDPNLRRLLDVAKRRDGENHNRHCVILKRENSSSKSRMIESLREQDAASLGLTIIWVDSYEQIPKIIRTISRTN